MWIFGYGSLVWKIDFPYSKRLVGYIQGFARRFWQASEDHRGTPEKPGRVATLIPSKDPLERTWGVAIFVPPEVQDQVKAHLDFREKCGYEQMTTTFHPSNPSESVPFSLTLYVGTEDNPHFIGPASYDEMADHILQCEGPSGSNIFYILELAKEMRKIAPEAADAHLYTLEKRLLEKLRSDKSLKQLPHLKDAYTFLDNS